MASAILTDIVLSADIISTPAQMFECLWDKVKIAIPSAILTRDVAKQEYRGHVVCMLDEKKYISPNGNPYCCLDCYVKFCED